MTGIDTESATSIQDSPVVAGTAVVAEGGGQRGIYTAGVLDAFLLAGFNPFEFGIGASAGAQNLFTYFIHLPGYAKRAIAELTADPNFFVPYRWLGKRGVIDLDNYFTRMRTEPDYQLPYQRVNALQSRRRLLFVATLKSCLSPAYLEPESHTVFDYMKASSAVPFLYKDGVSIDGETMLDGGISDPVPVRQAYALGARRLVVIRTVPASHRQSSWRQRLESLKIRSAMPRAAWDILERHEDAFQDALNFLQNPPPDAEVFEIAPQQPLKSSVFGSRSLALLEDYSAGLLAGSKALQTLKRWQTQSKSSVASFLKVELNGT